MEKHTVGRSDRPLTKIGGWRDTNAEASGPLGKTVEGCVQCRATFAKGDKPPPSAFPLEYMGQQPEPVGFVIEGFYIAAKSPELVRSGVLRRRRMPLYSNLSDPVSQIHSVVAGHEAGSDGIVGVPFDSPPRPRSFCALIL